MKVLEIIKEAAPINPETGPMLTRIFGGSLKNSPTGSFRLKIAGEVASKIWDTSEKRGITVDKAKLALADDIDTLIKTKLGKIHVNPDGNPVEFGGPDHLVPIEITVSNSAGPMKKKPIRPGMKPQATPASGTTTKTEYVPWQDSRVDTKTKQEILQSLKDQNVLNINSADYQKYKKQVLDDADVILNDKAKGSQADLARHNIVKKFQWAADAKEKLGVVGTGLHRAIDAVFIGSAANALYQPVGVYYENIRAALDIVKSGEFSTESGTPGGPEDKEKYKGDLLAWFKEYQKQLLAQQTLALATALAAVGLGKWFLRKAPIPVVQQFFKYIGQAKVGEIAWTVSNVTSAFGLQMMSRTSSIMDDKSFAQALAQAMMNFPFIGVFPQGLGLAGGVVSDMAVQFFGGNDYLELARQAQQKNKKQTPDNAQANDNKQQPDQKQSNDTKQEPSSNTNQQQQPNTPPEDSRPASPGSVTF
jgi:hypothetical protein